MSLNDLILIYKSHVGTKLHYVYFLAQGSYLCAVTIVFV